MLSRKERKTYLSACRRAAADLLIVLNSNDRNQAARAEKAYNAAGTIIKHYSKRARAEYLQEKFKRVRADRMEDQRKANERRRQRAEEERRQVYERYLNTADLMNMYKE